MIFENLRIVKLDDNGVLKYFWPNKKDPKNTINLRASNVSVRFLYKSPSKQDKAKLEAEGYPNCKGEFMIQSPNETFIFRDTKSSQVNKRVSDWEPLIRKFNTNVQVQLKM